MAGIVFGDMTGHVRYANRAFLSMWGYNDDSEVIGRPFHEFSTNPDAVLHALRQMQGRNHWTGQDVARRQDGSEFDTDLSVNFITDERSTPVGIMATMVDITARKKAERRSQEMLSQLAHLNRVSSMGEMATALAHEVNQPLGTIANYAGTCAQLIRERRIEMDALLNNIEKINEQTLRAGQVLSRLKQFVSRAVPQTTDLDINEICSNMRSLVELEAKSHGVTVRLDLKKPLPTVRGDAIQLQQVLVNLLLNAIESTHDKPSHHGEVTIATSCADEGISVSVIDNGRGIQESDFDLIFEPYHTTKPKGLGMGLSISRRIIAAHGGYLQAENHGNQGACFTFVLPYDPLSQ